MRHSPHDDHPTSPRPGQSKPSADRMAPVLPSRSEPSSPVRSPAVPATAMQPPSMRTLGHRRRRVRRRTLKSAASPESGHGSRVRWPVPDDFGVSWA